MSYNDQNIKFKTVWSFRLLNFEPVRYSQF